MTDNRLLLFRLAELMLEQEKNMLLVDELFDDEAESIMDYITGNIRQSVSFFYNKFLYKLA
jgi:hypothetical protein